MKCLISLQQLKFLFFLDLDGMLAFPQEKNKNVDMLKKQAKLTKKINIFTTSFFNQQILKLFILISI